MENSSFLGMESLSEDKKNPEKESEVEKKLRREKGGDELKQVGIIFCRRLKVQLIFSSLRKNTIR